MHNIFVLLMHASPLLVYSMVVFFLCLESSGIPLANTTVLLCTGALASFGHVNFWILCVVALGGSVLGACSAYIIGMYGGHKFLVRMATFFHIDEQRVVMVERWCKRSGLWMVFFSRVIPYVRPLGCFPAGVAQMNFAGFLAAATCGSLLWCIALLTIGWSLGQRWMQALSFIQQYTLPAFGTMLIILGLYCWVMYALRQNLQRHYEDSPLAADAEACERDLIEV